MLVLGVESSCDETSVAIYDGEKILSNVVLSQIDIHKEFGGVVPEVASRHHVRNVSIVFKEALELAGVTANEIDLVAVTEGPGLIGSLLVGITAAKTFAMMYNIPIIGVNHLAGHIYANQIDGIKEQIRRGEQLEDLPAPQLWLNPEVKSFYDFDNSKECKDVKVKNYKHHGKISFPLAR